ncbi:hypothetical protein RI845_12680 [Thalassotalea nanhaiensis]|uniref:Ankyrin repeat domain-containing protein n=1 Tax=Thalassotalea nanhaiensis TaxID=3065648 RepID=A0ABY9TF35_9GAMM|nr:hypothetical protein RI845_12680 [Colwelliaceae bacterium SQ345]
MKYLIVLSLLFTSLADASEKDEIEINLSKLPTGQHLRVEWYGFPVLILKPNTEQLDAIKDNKTRISEEIQSQAFQNFARSSGNERASVLYDSTIQAYQNGSLIHPYPLIVLMAVSPTQGCAIGAQKTENILINPCNKVTYSLDGRVLNSNGRFAANLLIPKYSVSDNKLKISAPKLAKLRDFSPDILASNQSKEAMVWEAVSWDKLDVLNHLVNKDKSILNIRTGVGCNLLHVASNKSSQLVSHLIDNGLSTTLICNGGYTPIMLSLLTKNTENAILLAKSGAKTSSYCEQGTCAKSLQEYLTSEARYSEKEANEVINQIKAAR